MEWIDVKKELPKKGEKVKVKYNNGEEAVGYYYDNYYRSGWMTNTGDGLFANHAWGGLFVTHWLKN